MNEVNFLIEWSKCITKDIESLNEDAKNMLQKIEDIKISTVENTHSLKDHMYRTEIAEKRLEVLEKELVDVRFFKKLLKISSFLFVLPGCIYYTMSIIKLLSH